MTPLVTVKKALRRGYYLIAFPTVLMILFSFSFLLLIGRQTAPPLWFIATGFLLSAALTWLYWNVASVKWQLWAFENVRNVHELKRKALQDNLLFEEENFFSKIQFVSTADQKKLEKLQEKFQEEDLFVDQYSIPSETIVYLSKTKSIFTLAVALIVIAVSLAAMAQTLSEEPGEFYTVVLIFGAVAVLFAGFFGFGKYLELKKNPPQIILNEQGIQTASVKFKKWAQIEDEKVIGIGLGNHILYSLVYFHSGGREEIKINDFTVSPKELEHLLYIYRGRSTAKFVPEQVPKAQSPEELFNDFFGKS